jgi:hypothetical protein
MSQPLSWTSDDASRCAAPLLGRAPNLLGAFDWDVLGPSVPTGDSEGLLVQVTVNLCDVAGSGLASGELCLEHDRGRRHIEGGAPAMK